MNNKYSILVNKNNMYNFLDYIDFKYIKIIATYLYKENLVLDEYNF